MVKKFSIEFKQQAVDYALSHTHLSISELTQNKTSHRELTTE
ncbi:hypothetical protein [Gilliamella sp. Occ4-3]|jgi:transposase